MSDLDWDDDKPTPPEGGAEPAQPAPAPAPADVKRGEQIANNVASKMLGDLGIGKKEQPGQVYNPSGYGYGYGGYGQRHFDGFDNDLDYTRPVQSNARLGPGLRYGGGRGNFKGAAWGGSSSSKGYKPKKFSDVVDYIDQMELTTADLFFDGFMEKFLEDNFLMGKFLGALQVWYGIGNPKAKKQTGLAADPDLEMPDE